MAAGIQAPRPQESLEATIPMTPEAIQMILAAKADEALADAPGLQAVLIIGSSSNPRRDADARIGLWEPPRRDRSG